MNFKLFNIDDANMFDKNVKRFIVYLLVFVDYMLMIENNENYILSIKKELKKGFEMKNLGQLIFYLGIEVT